MAGPSKGSKPDKIIRDALIIELNRIDDFDGEKVKKIHRVVRKLVACAMEGKIDAIREMFDRVEGKPKQEVDVAHDGTITLESAAISLLDALIAGTADTAASATPSHPLPN